MILLRWRHSRSAAGNISWSLPQTSHGGNQHKNHLSTPSSAPVRPWPRRRVCGQRGYSTGPAQASPSIPMAAASSLSTARPWSCATSSAGISRKARATPSTTTTGSRAISPPPRLATPPSSPPAGWRWTGTCVCNSGRSHSPAVPPCSRGAGRTRQCLSIGADAIAHAIRDLAGRNERHTPDGDRKCLNEGIVNTSPCGFYRL